VTAFAIPGVAGVLTAADTKPAPVDPAQAEKFMRQALELARKGMENGDGGPFGCVIVKDGAVIGEGWNRVVSTNDPTAHGEVVAIRETCTKNKNFSLKGCELYTTGEPCPMCLAAIYWARIDRVYYGFSCKDAATIGFDDSFIYEQMNKPLAARTIPEVQVLGTESFELLKKYAAKPNRVKY